MTLEVDQVLAWVHGARTGLADARGRIDAVNVFPVADADTGTNAWLTIEGGARAVDDLGAAERTAAEVLAVFARGAMLAARGNSGVILSQWLAGFVRRTTAAAADEPAGAVLAQALRAAARAARHALAEPQDGTVLTLADEVADAAVLGADSGATAPAVLAQAATAGHQSLARISATHPVLRRAHVPDAGACALLVVVDALVLAVTGGAPRSPAEWLPERGSAHEAQPGECGTEHAAAGGAFEVMLVVRGLDQGVGSRQRPTWPTGCARCSARSATRSRSWARTAGGTPTCTPTTRPRRSLRARWAGVNRSSCGGSTWSTSVSWQDPDGGGGSSS